MFRRTALVALAMTAVLGTPAIGAGPKEHLDGQKKTSHSYGGTLSGPTVYLGVTNDGAEVGAAEPHPSWCQASTCDSTELGLSLPPGRQSGRLVVELTVSDTEQSKASMHFVVYDNENEPLPGQSTCCTASRFVATRMKGGDYKIVVYVDAGAGDFDVDVSWTANPPHRSTPSS